MLLKNDTKQVFQTKRGVVVEVFIQDKDSLLVSLLGFLLYQECAYAHK